MKEISKTKAVALMSGGLDSTLAVMIVKRQGIDIYGLHFRHIYNTDITKPEYTDQLRTVMDQVGIPVKVVELTREITECVKNPRFGYGKHLNPCIDCRILQQKLAKQYMEEIGGSFIISGEVVGQRPKSQKKPTIRLIERTADTEGLILRPLTAKNLEPTIAEKQGLIDREKLYGLSGRSRKEQKKLAEELGILDYPESGGGCRLTYEGFSRKMKDLIDHKDPDQNDAYLLQAGRHFRVSHTGKAVVGKDEADNELISKLAREGDTLFEVEDSPGPIVLLRDPVSDDDIQLAAGLCVSHTKMDTGTSKTVKSWSYGSEKVTVSDIARLEKHEIEKMRI